MLANEEARLLDHNFVGTEHILLGLINEGDGTAARTLTALGVTAEAVRELVEETIGPADAPHVDPAPFSPRAKKTLELALREALGLNQNYIGTEHLLLGLIREREAVAAQILVAIAGDLTLVRQKLLSVLAGEPGRPHPLAAVDGGDVEVASLPVRPSSLLGWQDVLPILAGAVAADAQTRTAYVGGVTYETCTYLRERLPEISISVAAARVTREAFDRYGDRLDGVEELDAIGDAATYSAETQSLRVLVDGVVLVARVQRHHDPRGTAIAVAKRAVANLTANG